MKRTTIAALVACVATAVGIPAAQAHMLTGDRTDNSSNAAKASVSESTLAAMLEAGTSFHARGGSLRLHMAVRPDDRAGIRGV
jgi:hypothetical protein